MRGSNHSPEQAEVRPNGLLESGARAAQLVDHGVADAVQPDLCGMAGVGWQLAAGPQGDRRQALGQQAAGRLPAVMKQIVAATRFPPQAHAAATLPQATHTTITCH